MTFKSVKEALDAGYTLQSLQTTNQRLKLCDMSVNQKCKIRSLILAEFGGKDERQENILDPCYGRKPCEKCRPDTDGVIKVLL